MKHILKMGPVGLAALGLAACASTHFQSTWKAPDAAPVNFQGQKVAALVIDPNESTRLGVEGMLAREITARGVNGIPAFNLIPPKESRDKERAKELFNAAGIVGVVVLRKVGMEKELTSSPGSYWSGAYYGSFWGGGYYGYGWGAVYEPSYLRTDTIIRVETLVYDLKADKLIWAGMSESTNPNGASALVKELVAAAAAEMKKSGLIRSR